MVILDEKRLAERIINTGSTTLKPYKTFILVAKYLFSEGMPKSDVESRLTDLCAHIYRGNNRQSMTYWKRQFRKITADKKNREALFVCDGIGITENEKYVILSLNNKRLERLAFALLCFAKYNLARNPESGGWVWQDISDVFKSAQVAMPKEDRYKELNKLVRLGLIEASSKITNLHVKVNYIDYDSEPEYVVRDFERLDGEYQIMLGNKSLSHCRVCGKVIRENGQRNIKLCRECTGRANTKKPEYKKITCEKCGRWVYVDKLNTKTKRCKNCNSEIQPLQS